MNVKVKYYKSVTFTFEMSVNKEEKSLICRNDDAFEKMLQEAVRGHSFVHWTPVEVIKTAVDWLGTGRNNRVLDIGSGTGKFCLVAAMNSNAHYTGVELRENLYQEAQRLKSELELSNVEFIHGDVKNIDFNNFTSFYFYNPFCEHIAISGGIDDQISFDEDAFYSYQELVENKLKETPKGTKLVKYCSPELEISMDFDLHDMYFDGQLQLWIKN
ncbi:MAG: methyltransferase domain-containing protein [Flavobacteriales bacterium]|nr:methyltransferase domain-containing protein [Flavobacteriales bacterium]